MVYVLVSILVILAIAIFITLNVVNNGDKEEIDVVEDYSRLKTALLNFRKSGVNKCSSIEELRDFVEGPDDIAWGRYSISMDEKFLIVKNAKSLDENTILRKVGGTSYSSGGKLYLSFLSLNKISKVDVVANFNIVPSENVYTTTSLEYDTSACQCEDNEILEYKWEGKEARFSESGIHLVRLKIKDKNGNWSEWCEKEVEVKEKSGLKAIESSAESTYVIHNNGRVDVFGTNDYGQLGTNGIEPANKRTFAINLSNVDKLSAGEHHTLIKAYDGKVYSLGKNNYGQLGIASRSDSKTPKEVWGLESIKMVSAGNSFSGALSTSGRVYTWGDNQFGQLGHDKSSFREIPKVLDEVENVRQISFGYNHALALTFDGRVIGWGGNSYGQLGVGYKGRTLEPTITEFKNAKYVCAGKYTSYVITDSGRILVAGQNDKTQLGFEGAKEVLFPEEILSVKGAVKVVASNCGNFVVVMDEIGGIYTWGQYDNMQEKVIEKPYKIPNIKYIKDLSATMRDLYTINEDNEVLVWDGQSLKMNELKL